LLAFSRKQLLELKVSTSTPSSKTWSACCGPLIGENIELITRLAPDAGHTRADAGQLEQVIMNLVVNAKDAMPEGGKLTLQSQRDRAPNFSEHRFIQPGRYAVISVRHRSWHGQGNPIPHLRALFYHQRKRKGTGLGLSTVYGIVKQSNGYVFAQSEPGAGTTFTSTCRASKILAAELDPASSQTNEAGGCETALLVEDEESVRELVRVTLVSRGYKVLEAENGESGLRVAENYKGHIDILITDVVMPGIGWPRTGQEAARAAAWHLRALSLRLHRRRRRGAGPVRGQHGIPAETFHPAESGKKSPRSPAFPFRPGPQVHRQSRRPVILLPRDGEPIWPGVVFSRAGPLTDDVCRCLKTLPGRHWRLASTAGRVQYGRRSRSLAASRARVGFLR
jgi:CheY-like chemotaxis protein